MRVMEFRPKDGINAKSHRKGNYFSDCYQVILFDEKLVTSYHTGFDVLVDLRIYHSKSKCYACIWIHDRNKGVHCNGSGSAGGYGYDRMSAASAAAFESCGLGFDLEISGVGESAVTAALSAIADFLLHKTYFVNHTHA